MQNSIRNNEEYFFAAVKETGGNYEVSPATTYCIAQV